MIKVDLSNIQSFLRLPYEAAVSPRLKIAHSHLQLGNGRGGEFTGWVHLPRDYDRAEYERIKERFQGAGGHRHRRLLSGCTGRDRVPVLPQL